MSTLIAVRVPDDLVVKMDARGKRSRVVIDALRTYLEGGTPSAPPTAKPASGKPRARPPVDASLPDVVEEPAQPRPASIHTGNYQRPTHDAATCTAYGCGMCKVAKGK